MKVIESCEVDPPVKVRKGETFNMEWSLDGSAWHVLSVDVEVDMLVTRADVLADEDGDIRLGVHGTVL